MNDRAKHNLLVIVLAVFSVFGGMLGYTYWFIHLFLTSVIINLEICKSSKIIKFFGTFGVTLLIFSFFAYQYIQNGFEFKSLSQFYPLLFFAAPLGFVTAKLIKRLSSLSGKVFALVGATLVFFIMHGISTVFVLKSIGNSNSQPIIQYGGGKRSINYIWGTNCGSCILSIKNSSGFFNSENVNVYLAYRSEKDSVTGKMLLLENTNFDIDKLRYIRLKDFYDRGGKAFPIMEIYNNNGNLVFQGPYITRWFIPNRLACAILAL